MIKDKIVSLEQLREIVAQKKEQGQNHLRFAEALTECHKTYTFVTFKLKGRKNG